MRVLWCVFLPPYVLHPLYHSPILQGRRSGQDGAHRGNHFVRATPLPFHHTVLTLQKSRAHISPQAQRRQNSHRQIPQICSSLCLPAVVLPDRLWACEDVFPAKWTLKFLWMSLRQAVTTDRWIENGLLFMHSLASKPVLSVKGGFPKIARNLKKTETQRTPTVLETLQDSELLRHSVFIMPPDLLRRQPLKLRGKCLQNPGKLWLCRHSKSLCDTKFTTHSKSTTA